MTSAAGVQLPTSMTAGKLINGVLFNITWLAVVYTHSALWALVITAAHLALHFSLISSRFAEARLILGLTLFGAILDQILFVLGVFAYKGASAAAPVWMSCLWPVLGTTLLHAFRGLQHAFCWPQFSGPWAAQRPTPRAPV